MQPERELRAALAEAIDLIHAYHGEPGWSDYQASPEMKRLKAALALRGGAVSGGPDR